MRATYKLLLFLGIGVVLNILYILIFIPKGIKEGANVIQLLLFVVAWIIVEVISLIAPSEKKEMAK